MYRISDEFVRRAGVLLIAIATSACAASSGAVAPSVASAGPAASLPGIERSDEALLNRLWRERSTAASDFPIGPGDLLEVTVPGIDQLQHHATRVDGNGNIYLPLAGELEVGGKTEKEVRTELNQRMSRFLYDPHVDLFVKNYDSREVAVMGAVGRPGMYILNSPQDTIHELIERAGGMTVTAAPKIVLTPGQPAREKITEPERPRETDQTTLTAPDHTGFSVRAIDEPLGPVAPVPADSDVSADSHVFDDVDTRSALVHETSAIINLGSGFTTSRYMDLPLRPGDTIYVPSAGSVTVVGWVYHPKTMPVTPGLTVLGAISAAGGPLFAANTKSIKLIRQKDDGQSVISVVNLDQVENRTNTVTLVRANDIIDVPYSAIRLPGYALYYAAQGIVSWAPAAAVVGGVP